jgi:hypothetical protein
MDQRTHTGDHQQEQGTQLIYLEGKRDLQGAYRYEIKQVYCLCGKSRGFNFQEY